VNKTVIAEGVETVTQQAALHAMGVASGQGFLWTPALPPASLISWLDSHARSLSPRAGVAEPAPPAEASEDARESIFRMRRDGASLHTIAAALNLASQRTGQGRRWVAASVAHELAVRPPPPEAITGGPASAIRAQG